MNRSLSRILIVKCSSLGDIVQSFPVLSYLRDRYPEAEIDWVLEERFSQLVKSHPSVNQVISIDSKRWRDFPRWRGELRKKSYDVAFDLQGNIKSGIVLSQARAREKVGYTLQGVSEWPNLLFTHRRYSIPKGANIREDYLALVKSFLGDSSASTIHSECALHSSPEQMQEVQQLRIDGAQKAPVLALVCPGSAWPNKRLGQDTLQRFLTLWSQREKVCFLLLWGNAAEQQQAIQLSQEFAQTSLVVPKLALPALQRLMSEVDYVFSMDSLPLHLAGTTSTPSFAVFGPSSSQKYCPLGAGSFNGGCPYGVQFEKRCPRLRTCESGACMSDIPADELFSKFWDWKVRCQLEKVKSGTR